MKIEDYKWLEAHKPLACILKDGQGLTELSFAMKFSPDYIQVYWSGKAYSILGEHEINGPKDALYNLKDYPGAIIVDPCDPNCPIEVDLEIWVGCLLGESNKYFKRNAPFKIKVPIAG